MTAKRRNLFQRHMRVRSKRDFERAYRDGARARASELVVVVCPNGLPHARLGLSVGRIVWKSAVRRNRVRRIFREAFRLSYAELPVGIDIVMIPAAPRLDPTLAVVQAELVALARKALRRATDPDRPPRTAARTRSKGGARPLPSENGSAP